MSQSHLYISNFALRKELILEETNNISNKEKIRKLTKEIEACERYIFYLEKNLVSREDEIDQLKAECQSTLVELGKYQDHLELKEEALVAQDERIIQLEDTVDKLKKRIQELSLCKEKIEMDEDNELFNPILRILDRRRAVADYDVFNATTQSLDEIIRQAALMQEIDLIRNQARIAGIQIANLGIRFLNKQSDSKPTESDS
ncbi:hypothetical protein GLOIN_2v1885507 [Rhizophagus irregularis DAOM 181602=DAOM 197198]|nr:hypothetical protein GLOIN_2v1885507 [Rhizophagus irregularis DAOM 181602=DAOM 197198]